MTYGVSNQEIISPFSNCNYQCLLHAVIMYHILFIIVVLLLLYLSYSVNVCLYWDHNRNKCLQFLCHPYI